MHPKKRKKYKKKKRIKKGTLLTVSIASVSKISPGPLKVLYEVELMKSNFSCFGSRTPLYDGTYGDWEGENGSVS